MKLTTLAEFCTAVDAVATTQYTLTCTKADGITKEPIIEGLREAARQARINVKRMYSEVLTELKRLQEEYDDAAAERSLEDRSN